MRVELSFTVSSGNVFADLDIPEPEEELAKADLAFRLSQRITEQGCSQARAAEQLGLDEAEVLALLHGQLDAFSVEQLLRLL